jgi:hypothetical protein
MTEEQIRIVMNENGFDISNMCYAVTNDRQFFEYDLVIKTRKEENLKHLARCLETTEDIIEFKLCPSSD